VLVKLYDIDDPTRAINFTIGESSITTSPTFKLWGYLTNDTASQYIAHQIDDTDDYYHITKGHANILGMKIDMATNITTGLLTASGGLTVVGTTTLDTGLTGLIRADSGVLSIDTDVTDLVSASSKTLAGKVELATTAEIDTGTDSTRAIPVDQLVASKRNVRWLVFNLVEAGTACATATNIAGDFVSPIAGTILQNDSTPFYLYATNSTAGINTGTGLVVDISIGGTSIMTTNKLDFDTTEKTTTTAATPPDLTTTALAVGNIITIDIVSIHDGTAAKGLTVYMAVRE